MFFAKFSVLSSDFSAHSIEHGILQRQEPNPISPQKVKIAPSDISAYYYILNQEFEEGLDVGDGSTETKIELSLDDEVLGKTIENPEGSEELGKTLENPEGTEELGKTGENAGGMEEVGEGVADVEDLVIDESAVCDLNQNEKVKVCIEPIFC